MSWFSKLRRGMFGGPSPTYDGIGGGRRAIAWQVGNPGAVAALAFTQNELRAKSRDLVRRNAWAAQLGLMTVPRLHTGHVDMHQLREWVHVRHSQFRHGPLEGLVIRRENGDWLEQRAKLVRADFTQAIESHWRSRTLQWNHVESQFIS